MATQIREITSMEIFKHLRSPGLNLFQPFPKGETIRVIDGRSPDRWILFHHTVGNSQAFSKKEYPTPRALFRHIKNLGFHPYWEVSGHGEAYFKVSHGGGYPPRINLLRDIEQQMDFYGEWADTNG